MELIVLGIKCTGEFIINQTENSNPVKYEIQYDSRDEKLNIEIDLKDRNSESEIYLPDGAK